MSEKRTLDSKKSHDLTTSIQPNYKIWQNHYDFSEINKTNYQSLLHSHFKITTKKITFIAMMLVLSIILSVFSKFVLGLFPIGGFLTFNIGSWLYLTTYLALGFLPTFFFLEVCTWFNFFLGSDVVACLAINLSDLTLLLFFSCFLFVINFFRSRFCTPKTLKKRKWFFFSAIVISFTLAMLLTACLDVVYNQTFLIDLYYANTAKPTEIKPILITVLWFNIVQYLVNFLSFTPTFSVSYLLIDRYFR